MVAISARAGCSVRQHSLGNSAYHRFRVRIKIYVHLHIGAHVTSLRLLGQPRLISIWDGFSKSPVVTKFQWSSLVLRAVERNVPILSAPRNYVQKLSAGTRHFIPGLVTLHVRRMDYESRKSAVNCLY